MPPIPASVVETLAHAYRTGASTPEAVARDCLARARGPDAASAFITLTDDIAQREARASQRRWGDGTPRSALDGMPFAYKDLMDVAGLPTTSGSRITSNAPAARDAPVIAALRRAGAVTIGKTNLSEFAFSGLGTNPHFGTPINPHGPPDEPRICGGSSSGSAAAVARSLSAVAIGTDTSGSVRIPAAYCGIVGYRPSCGRYSSVGVGDLAPTFDTVGPLARTVRDVRFVDDLLLGRTAHRRRSARSAPLRLVWVDTDSIGPLSDAVERACSQWRQKATDQGVVWSDTELPELRDAVDAFRAHGTLVAAEASYLIARRYTSAELDRVDPWIATRLRTAMEMRASDAVALYRLRTASMASLAKREGDTVFAWPTVPTVAPKIADIDATSFARINAEALRLTMPASFLDMPSIALPCGTSPDGLPVSVQLAVVQGGDDRLLDAAERLESLGLVGA